VPLAYYLSHPLNMNVKGLWAGFATAAVLQATLQFFVISRLDWDAEVGRFKSASCVAHSASVLLANYNASDFCHGNNAM